MDCLKGTKTKTGLTRPLIIGLSLGLAVSLTFSLGELARFYYILNYGLAASLANTLPYLVLVGLALASAGLARRGHQRIAASVLVAALVLSGILFWYDLAHHRDFRWWGRSW